MKPPSHLKKPARDMWASISADYDVSDGAGLSLLQAACESFQRASEARAIIDKAGAVVTDRFGQEKPHPAVGIERDSRAAMVSALRALRLEPGE